MFCFYVFLFFFFFNDTATTEIYTLSLHDALPIQECRLRVARRRLGLPLPNGYLRNVPLLPGRDARQNGRLLLLLSPNPIWIEPPPASLQHHPTPREESLASHRRDDARVLEPRRRKKDRQKTPRDEIVDLRLVRRQSPGGLFIRR